MVLQNRPLNEFDKSTDISESLEILKKAVSRSGFKFEMFPIKKHKSNINSFYTVMLFPELGVGANGKGTTEEASLASAYGEACERLQSSAFSVRKAGNIVPYFNYSICKGTYLEGYTFSEEEKLKDSISIESFFKNIEHSPENIEALKKCNISKHWVKGYSILQEKDVMVPFQLASILNGSSGLSAGITIEDAIIQGASECFERFAVRTLLSGKREIPTIPNNTFNSGVKSLIQSMEQEGFKITFKDFSLNNTIPVVAVIIESYREPEGKLSRKGIVFGASPNMDIGATRCITEYFQGWEFHVNECRRIDVVPPAYWSQTPNLWDSKLQYFIGDLNPLLNYKAESLGYCSPKEKTTKSYIDYLSNSCKALNTDFIVVNLTNSTINIPTVRIIMPGVSELAPMQHNLTNNKHLTKKWFKEFIEVAEVVDSWEKYYKGFINE